MYGSTQVRFYAEQITDRMIRAVFDLLFTMCHLIASISPYHTLLVPHITTQRERGHREKQLEMKKDSENPINLIYRTIKRKKKTSDGKPRHNARCF